MADIKTFIQIRFKEKTQFGEFNDSIYYTEEAYKGVKQKDIDDEIARRVDNWLTVRQTPPVPIEVTKEELEEKVRMIEATLEENKQRLAEKG